MKIICKYIIKLIWVEKWHKHNIKTYIPYKLPRKLSGVYSMKYMKFYNTSSSAFSILKMKIILLFPIIEVIVKNIQKLKTQKKKNHS